MNTETPKQAASYGEPWMHAPTWDILQTSEGKCIIYGAHHMEEPYLTRIVQCVNACAGIADPEKAIRDAREWLSTFHEYLTSSGHTATARELSKVLAQLNNA